MVNTASIGAYPHYVATREKWEHKVGKAAAGLYAMIHTLRHGQPVRISYDGNTVTTSLFFLGNSVYLPSGFAPAPAHPDGRRADGRQNPRERTTIQPAADYDLARPGQAGTQSAVPRTAGSGFSFTAVDGPIAVARDGEVDRSAPARASPTSTVRSRFTDLRRSSSAVA